MRVRFVKMLVPFFAAAAFATGTMSYIGTNSDEIPQTVQNEEISGFIGEDAGRAMLSLMDYHIQVRDIAGFTDMESINTANRKIIQAKADYARLSKNVGDKLQNEDAETLYEDILKQYDAYVQKAESIISIGNNTSPTYSGYCEHLIVSELDPMYNRLYDMWNKLYEMGTAETDIALPISSDNEQSDILPLLTIAFAAAAFLSSVIAVISDRCVNAAVRNCTEGIIGLSEGNFNSFEGRAVPSEAEQLMTSINTASDNLRRICADMTNVLSRFAEGDFTADSAVPQLYKGELAEILKAMRKAVQTQSQAALQICRQTNKLAEETEYVFAKNRSFSHELNRQSSAAVSLKNNMKQLSDEISVCTAAASEAFTAACDTSVCIKECRICMADIVNGIDSIAEFSRKSHKAAEELEEITALTNKMAVNAAMEASRSGASGRTLVRLADESRRIASRMAALNKSMLELDESMANCGKISSKNITEKLSFTQTNSQKLSDAVDRICEASEKQNKAIEKIISDIQYISESVGSSSSEAAENSAAAQELSKKTEELRMLMNRFRIKE